MFETGVFVFETGIFVFETGVFVFETGIFVFIVKLYDPGSFWLNFVLNFLHYFRLNCINLY